MAQDEPNVVTTAVPFLRISPDARAGGMGEVGIATLPDVNSTFWNLAKTPFNTSKGAIAMSYIPWLKNLGLNDVYMAALVGYYKLMSYRQYQLHALFQSVRFNLPITRVIVERSGRVSSRLMQVIHANYL